MAGALLILASVYGNAVGCYEVNALNSPLFIGEGALFYNGEKWWGASNIEVGF